MTIEEIKQAKQEAEARVQEVLAELQQQTGMSLADVQVRYITFDSLKEGRTRIVPEVHIDLRV